MNKKRKPARVKIAFYSPHKANKYLEEEYFLNYQLTTITNINEFVEEIEKEIKFNHIDYPENIIWGYCSVLSSLLGRIARVVELRFKGKVIPDLTNDTAFNSDNHSIKLILPINGAELDNEDRIE